MIGDSLRVQPPLADALEAGRTKEALAAQLADSLFADAQTFRSLGRREPFDFHDTTLPKLGSEPLRGSGIDVPATKLWQTTAVAPAHAPADHSLLERIRDAHQLNADSMRHPHVSIAVDSLLSAVQRLGSVGLVASSTAGERLLGALLFSSESMRCWVPGDEDAVLIDGYIAGTAGLADAAQRLRRLGTRRVHAFTLGAMCDVAPPVGVETLTVLAVSRHPVVAAAG